MNRLKFRLYLSSLTVFFSLCMGCAWQGSILPSSSSSQEAADAALKNLGPFSIVGITGGSDSSLDYYLNTTTFPTLNWTSSSGADFYEVAVYDQSGSNLICTSRTTTDISYDFSSCNLTVGQSFQAVVWARINGSAGRFASSNNKVLFYVNQVPVVSDDTMTLLFNGAGFTGNPISNASGLDSDPDGDTLTIVSVSTALKGTAALASSTTVSYTPTGAAYGADSFTYTVSDGRGGVATATVQVKLMTPYTWMGLVDSVWANNNWCGSVSSPGFSGVCSGGGPPTSATTTTHKAVFNSFCTINCSPTIASTVSMYALDVDSSYTGTITQSSASLYNITIGAGGFWLRSGNFVGGTGSLTVGPTTSFCDNSNMGLSVTTAGSFTSTSGLLRINVCHVTMTPGTFNHNNGTVTFYSQFVSGSSDQNLISGNHHFYDFNMIGTQNGIHLNNGTLYIDRDLTINRSGSGGRINAGTIYLGRNLNLTQCTISAQTDLSIILTGSNSTITGASSGVYPTSTANCPVRNLISNLSGALTISGSLSVKGNYVINSGTVSAAGTVIDFASESFYQGTANITPGAFTYNHVRFNGFNAVQSFGTSTMNIAGDLVLADLGSGTINDVTFNVLGNLELQSAGTRNGNYQVQLNGTNQTITGVSGAKVNSLTINSSGTVTLSGTITLNNNYIFNSGTLSAAGSTLYFNHNNNTTYTIQPGSGNYANVIFDLTTTTYFNFPAVNWNILGNLQFGATGGTPAIYNVAIQLYGNLSSTGIGIFTGAGSPSTIRILGAGRTISQTIGSVFPGSVFIGDGVTVTSVTSSNHLTLNLVSQSLTISNSATLAMTSGFNLTVSDATGLNNILTVDAGGIINMNGGTRTQEVLVNNGTINP